MGERIKTICQISKTRCKDTQNRGGKPDMRESRSLVSYCELKYSKPNAETVFKIMPSPFPFIIPVHTM